MKIVLHLTERCNLRCSYCLERHHTKSMSLDTAVAAIEQLMTSDKDTVVFFGGEPLLEEETLFAVCHWAETHYPRHFSFVLTTNGTMVDEDFLDKARKFNLHIAISCDGIPSAHDRNRKDIHGKGTSHVALNCLKRLLLEEPETLVKMTLPANNVRDFTSSIVMLVGMGVKNISTTIDMDVRRWNDDSFEALRLSYPHVARFYLDCIEDGKPFTFSMFEKRFRLDVHQCGFGKSVVVVSEDGCFFPCTGFVRNQDFCIGDVKVGLQKKQLFELFQKAHSIADSESCHGCELFGQCPCRCACRNFRMTGSFSPHPVFCRHEKILFETIQYIKSEANRRNIKLPVF